MKNLAPLLGLILWYSNFVSGLSIGHIERSVVTNARKSHADMNTIQASVLSKAELGKHMVISPMDIAPPAPLGFQLAFGPGSGATTADGYMGFVLLDVYDVEACAQECKDRAFDAVGGACQFFNIWTSVTNGTAVDSVCALYSRPATADSATNTGSVDVSVADSCGYTRISALFDGGFESAVCNSKEAPVCDSPFWLPGSPFPSGIQSSGAHSGHSHIALVAADQDPSQVAEMTSLPLATIPGSQYKVTLFQKERNVTEDAKNTRLFQVLWNQETVLTLPDDSSST